jgi:dephospho-CoA kinase
MKEKDHLIIGLTGNIGSGKSSVLNMLRHLGAYGIDADALARKAYEQEETAAKIKACFGNLGRKALAQHVFNDAQALADLESIIHPQVTRMAKMLIKHSALPVIVVEAIKLLESDLASMCDQIWVVAADEAQVVKRLIEARGMDRTEILQRLANQSPLTEKIGKADVVIQNNHTYKDTWEQTEAAWHALLHSEKHKNIRARTNALYSPFLRHIVQPFSTAHTRMRAMITEGQAIQWIPNIAEVSLDLMDKWVCHRMVFATEEVSDATQFSVWRMNTFDFVMQAVIKNTKETQTSQPYFLSVLAELFAVTHRVESLTIAVPSPFKRNDKQALENMGFMAVDEKHGENAGWLKAGYNVFYKQIWDLLADLEDMRPTK